jgi:hypothetical protein
MLLSRLLKCDGPDKTNKTSYSNYFVVRSSIGAHNLSKMYVF